MSTTLEEQTADVALGPTLHETLTQADAHQKKTHQRELKVLL